MIRRRGGTSRPTRSGSWMGPVCMGMQGRIQEDGWIREESKVSTLLVEIQMAELEREVGNGTQMLDAMGSDKSRVLVGLHIGKHLAIPAKDTGTSTMGTAIGSGTIDSDHQFQARMHTRCREAHLEGHLAHEFLALS